MMSLVGGNAEAGKKVFVERNELACVRCHKIGDKGGEVGPVLTEIGKQKTREYLLESIVHPNKEIAKGFDTVVIELDDGSLVTGIVKSETPTELTLINADAKTFTVKKDAIVVERMASRRCRKICATKCRHATCAIWSSISPRWANQHHPRMSNMVQNNKSLTKRLPAG